MRLNWFLPALRKRKSGEKSDFAWPERLVRRMLPNGLFSNRTTKQRGWVRKFLRRLGTSWLYSPLRRVLQAVCFLIFVWLFFYVCWPYTAEPGRVSAGWVPVESDAATGETILERDSADDLLLAGRRLHVADESIEEEDQRYLGVFRIVSTTGNRLVLEPGESFSTDEMEGFSFSFGPWSLHEGPPDWPRHYTDDLTTKERIPAEIMLAIDPLVSLSTAIASRSWVWSLGWAAILLAACLWVPRGFCGYICPLGTLIDLFDWSFASRVKRFRINGSGWWVHLKYYLLLGTLVAALFGVLVSGYVAAIPVVTRAFLFIGEPIQSGTLRSWHLVAPLNAGHAVSIGLFCVVLGLGFLQPRFWCKYVCPSGAVFSVANLFRASERKVESTCIHCNKCVEVCPFDAIKPDFTTRTTDCTLCQTCGGVCPTHAIKFVERSNRVELKVLNDPPTNETAMGRRGFLSAAVGTAAAVGGGIVAAKTTSAFGADLGRTDTYLPIRPPGSVPEQQFLQLCIRCGECFKACPNNVLQAVGFQQGLEGLWTPEVKADWAGCESSCNACTQVCPTSAIRPLPLEEKRFARIGLAIVNQETCLPFANREACQLCVDECVAAGYDAIEFTQVHTEVDDSGRPVEDSGYLAPIVLPDKCVGCGLCQTRCYGINVAEKALLKESAIVIEAGANREDRLMRDVSEYPTNVSTGFEGSYAQLRLEERQARDAELDFEKETEDSYLPDFLR